MKYLFSALLIMATLATLSGQSIKYINIDGFFYAVTQSRVENAVGRPSVSVDTSAAYLSQNQAINNALRRKASNLDRFNRSRTAIIDRGFAQFDNSIDNALSSLGFDVDSILTHRTYRQIFIDTAMVFFRAEDVPEADRNDYGIDSTSTGIFTLLLEPWPRPNGTIRLRSVTTPGSWRIVFSGQDNFRLANWLGGVTKFFTFRERSNGKVFVTDDAVLGAPSSRMVIIADDNPIN